MPYSYLTFGQMQTLLAQRLSDPSFVFYSQPHVRSVLREALRCWQAMSGFARDRFAFNTTAGTSFYDLGTVAGSLLTRSVTDQQLVNDLQYALMENVNDFSSSSAWAGTGMFTMADLVGALQRRRDQFLLETGCVLSFAEVASGNPPDGRVALNAATVDVRRAAWKTSAGLYTNLWRSDERQLNALSIGWSTNPAFPQVFSTIMVPPLTMQLGPIPDDVGALSLVTINSGQTLDVSVGIPLGIPDDYCWGLKFGALADLLGKDGESRDPQRASHCEQRYSEAVMLAKINAVVLNLEVNGQQVPLTTLLSLDSMRPGWQASAGVPSIGALAGPNLLALSPVLSAVQGVTIDCVRTAQLPANDGASVQIDKPALDAVLDYATYLARFKEGGAEFEATIPLAQNMMKLAADSNLRLRVALQEQALREQSTREYKRRPMRVEAVA